MKLYIKADNSAQFTTFEIHNVDSILASKRFISDIESKRRFSDELFAFIDEAYDDMGGFRSFKDMDRFINDSYMWYVTYFGPVPQSELELDVNRIYVVSVYRKNHGMKLVGLARRKIKSAESSRSENIELRRNANSAVIQHIRFMSRIGWAEVSDKLEKFFKDTLDINAIIDPYDLKSIAFFQILRYVRTSYITPDYLEKMVPKSPKSHMVRLIGDLFSNKYA